MVDVPKPAPCPRPKCTAKAVFRYSQLIDGWLALCECHGTGSDYGVTKADAVEKWNAWSALALASKAGTP